MASVCELSQDGSSEERFRACCVDGQKIFGVDVEDGVTTLVNGVRGYMF